MSAKIQALEKLIKTDHRDIQIQTEEFKGEPMPALHYKVREEQEVMVSYGMYSPFVKQVLNSWSTCNRIITQDRKDLVTAALEPHLQLQWRTW